MRNKKEIEVERQSRVLNGGKRGESMKLNKSIFRYIEHELYNYGSTKKEIAELKEDIITGVPQVETVVQSGTSDQTLRKTEKLMTNKVLQRMEKTIRAIDMALVRLGDQHRQLFELKYQQGLPWQQVVMEMVISERSYFNYRRELVFMVAEQMGLSNLQ